MPETSTCQAIGDKARMQKARDQEDAKGSVVVFYAWIGLQQ